SGVGGTGSVRDGGRRDRGGVVHPLGRSDFRAVDAPGAVDRRLRTNAGKRPQRGVGAEPAIRGRAFAGARSPGRLRAWRFTHTPADGTKQTSVLGLARPPFGNRRFPPCSVRVISPAPWRWRLPVPPRSRNPLRPPYNRLRTRVYSTTSWCSATA